MSEQVRPAIQTAIATIILVLAGSTGAAQWVKNLTPGIPRTADGSVDMTAPVPRTAAGRPGLSGVWRSTYAFSLVGVDVPLQPWAAEVAKRRAGGDGKGDPSAMCLPWGIPRFAAFGYQKISNHAHGRHPLRGEYDVPAGIHGRSFVAGRSATIVDGVHRGQMGR